MMMSAMTTEQERSRTSDRRSYPPRPTSHSSPPPPATTMRSTHIKHKHAHTHCCARVNLYGPPLSIPETRNLKVLTKRAVTLGLTSQTDYLNQYLNFPHHASTYRGRVLVTERIVHRAPKSHEKDKVGHEASAGEGRGGERRGCGLFVEGGRIGIPGGARARRSLYTKWSISYWKGGVGGAGGLCM